MSNINVQNVQRMRFYAEPNGSLGIDHSATLGDYIDIPFIEGSADVKMDYESQSPGFARQDRDEHPIEILLRKRGTLTFSVPFLAADARAAAAVTMARTPLGHLLKLIFGGEDLGTGDTVDDLSAAVDSFVVTNISRWKAGGALGWKDADGVLHCREIAQVVTATSTVSLKVALPAAPANADVLYNCATYYLDNHNSSDVKTAQFIIEGLGNSDFSGGFEDCWVLLGGQATTPPKFELVNGTIPKVTFTFTFASWVDSLTCAMDPGALTPAGYNWVDTACDFATTGNITLANSQLIDGATRSYPNRGLVWKQTNPIENGLYVVTDSGAWVRATDFDTQAEAKNAAVNVLSGTAYAGHWFTQTIPTSLPGTDALNFIDMGTGLDEMTYVNTNTFANVDSEMLLTAVGSTSYANLEINASEYTIDPQIKYQEVTSPNGINNIAGYVITADHPKVSGSLSLPYENFGWYLVRNTKVAMALWLQIGSSYTYGAILLACPTIQLTDFQRKDLNGLAGQVVPWKGRRDTDTTEAVPSVLGHSPLRVHCF
jgi:hypothetical protein